MKKTENLNRMYELISNIISNLKELNDFYKLKYGESIGEFTVNVANDSFTIKRGDSNGTNN